MQIRNVSCPMGTVLLPNFPAIFNDAANVGDAPESFNPARFLPPHALPHHSGANAKDAKFCPFSVGRRMCPGVRLAMTIEAAFLSAVVRR